MAFDGSINIDTSVDPKGFEKGTSNVNRLLERIKNALVSTGNSISDAFGEKQQSKINTLTERYNRQSEALKKQTILVDELKNKYEKMLSGEVVPQTLIKAETELKQIQKEIEKTENEYKNFENQLAEAEQAAQLDIATLGTISPENKAEIERTIGELDRLGLKLGELDDKSEQLNKTISDIKLSPESGDEATKLNTQINLASDKMVRLKNEADATEAKINDALGSKPKEAEKGFDRAGKSANKATKEAIAFGGGLAAISKKIDDFGKRISRLIMATFVFNVIRQGLRQLTNYLSATMKTNTEFVNSLSQIKGNLLTAFQPIYEAIMPALNSLMSALANVTAQMAVFINTILGRSVTQSQEAAKALYNQAKATKEVGKAAKTTSASIDELNVITEDTAASSAALAEAETAPSFEINTTQMDMPLLDRFMNWLENVKEAAGPTLTSLGNLWDTLKEIGGFVIPAALQGFYENFLKPVGVWTLGTGIPRFIDALNEMLKSINWQKIIDSANNLWKALVPFAIHVGEGLLWFWENVLVPLGGWVLNKAVPAFLDAIAAVIPGLDKNLQATGNGFKYLWDNGLRPLLGWIGDKILDFFKWVSNNGKLVADLLIGIAAGFIAFKIIETLPKLINGVMTAFTGIGASLPTLAVALGTGLLAFVAFSDMSPELTALLSVLGGAFIALGVAMTVGMGPVGWIIGAIVGLGAAIGVFVLAMQKDAIPAIERFDNTVSDATRKVVGEFMNMFDETTVLLKGMMWSGEEITGKMAGKVVANFAKMREQAIDALTKQRDEAITELNYLFKKEAEMHEKRLKQIETESQALVEKVELARKTYGEESEEYRLATFELETFQTERYKSLRETDIQYLDEKQKESEQAYQDELLLINNKYKEQKASVEEREEEIVKIIRDAFVEKRGLTEEENAKLLELGYQFQEEVIRSLTDNELEQMVILERLKMNAEDLSAKQAAEVIKNAIQQKEGVIAEAEEQYNKTLAEIIRQRDETGEISDEQAAELIAKAQLQRDETIAAAEEMHKRIVEEAQLQAGEHVKAIDWETGEIRSTLSLMWDDIKEGLKIGMNAVIDVLNFLLRGVNSLLSSLINSVISGINKMIEGVLAPLNLLIAGLNMIPGMKIPTVSIKIPSVPDFGQYVYQIPRLATGAVLPANQPFVAMLGDQKHGRNIEAPEGLIRQIVSQELAKANAETGKETNQLLMELINAVNALSLVVNLDGQQIASSVEKYQRNRGKSTTGGAFLNAY